MADLVAILNTLADKDGKIQIPGIMDDVEELTEKERSTYSTIDFDIEAYRADLGASQLLHDTKVRALRLRNISLCRTKAGGDAKGSVFRF